MEYITPFGHGVEQMNKILAHHSKALGQTALKIGFIQKLSSWFSNTIAYTKDSIGSEDVWH